MYSKPRRRKTAAAYACCCYLLLLLLSLLSIATPIVVVFVLSTRPILPCPVNVTNAVIEDYYGTTNETIVIARRDVIDPISVMGSTSGATVVTDWSPSNLSADQLLSFYNFTFTTTSSRKRVIASSATAPELIWVEELALAGITQFPNNDADEIYESYDTGDTYYLASSNMVSVAPYGTTGVSFLVLSSIFPARCYSADALQPQRSRFDHEAGRFVMAVMAAGRYCIAISSTEDPASPWTLFEFVDVSFSYTNAFEFAVWGDYYQSCWLHSTNQTCVIFERTAMVVADGTPRMLILRNEAELFSISDALSATPPPYPLHQASQERGTFLNESAPCGAFAIIDVALQSIRMLHCVALNFTTGIISFTPVSVAVTGDDGPWLSFQGDECDGPGYGSPGCIYGLGILPYPTFSTYIRMAYSATASEFAYIFTRRIEANKAGALWGRMSAFETAATTYTALDPPHSSYMVPTVAYDCHNTLFIVVLWVPGLISNYTTYHFAYVLANAPPGTITNTLNFQPGSITTSPNIGFPHLTTASNRTARLATVTPLLQVEVVRIVSTEVLVTFTDSTSRSRPCTQSVFFNDSLGECA